MRKIDLTGSIAKAAQAAKNIAIIAGIAVTIFGLWKGYNELKMAAQSQKLASFGTVKELIKADEAERAKINEIVAKKDSIPQLLKDHGCVEHFYDSPEGATIASVGRHYEELGALVRLDYIRFDVVYEVVPFPDGFWAATKPIREEAQSNWSIDENGKHTGLRDFWKNFEYLKQQYDRQRDLDRKKAQNSTQIEKARDQKK